MTLFLLQVTEQLIQFSDAFYGLEVDSISEGSIIVNMSLYFATAGSYSSDNLTDWLMSNLSYWNQYSLDVVSVVVEGIEIYTIYSDMYMVAVRLSSSTCWKGCENVMDILVDSNLPHKLSINPSLLSTMY